MMRFPAGFSLRVDKWDVPLLFSLGSSVWLAVLEHSNLSWHALFLLSIMYFLWNHPLHQKPSGWPQSREKAWYSSCQERLHQPTNCLDTYASFMTSQSRITQPIQHNMLQKHRSWGLVQHPRSLQENWLITSSEWKRKNWTQQQLKTGSLSD